MTLCQTGNRSTMPAKNCGGERGGSTGSSLEEKEERAWDSILDFSSLDRQSNRGDNALGLSDSKRKRGPKENHKERPGRERNPHLDPAIIKRSSSDFVLEVTQKSGTTRMGDGTVRLRARWKG